MPKNPSKIAKRIFKSLTFMFTVALIGADGAGKSTISRQLENVLPVPVKSIYMGINTESSNYLLPTTMLWHKLKRGFGGSRDLGGPPDPSKNRTRPKSLGKRVFVELKSVFLMANLIAEEIFRQIVAWYYQVRGYIVLFDRHFFFDYFAHHISGSIAYQPIGHKLHGYFLNKIFPKPDLVICLDAPAEVLYARKREGGLELIEKRRQEYFQFRNLVKHYVIVDVTKSQEEVSRQVGNLIKDFYRSKREGSIFSFESSE